MPLKTRWWDSDPAERYWLESTDRPDIGADLKAPIVDESGKDNWRYTLFQEAKIGDLVFHYDKKVAAITAVSRIAGPAVEAQIVWAARGTYARERGAVPSQLPGYRMPLSDYTPLASPVPLAEIRQKRKALDQLYSRLHEAHDALYFPFELGKRDTRPLQGYAFKLPAAFLNVFPNLTAGADQIVQASVLNEAAIFENCVAKIEAAASRFSFGRLQQVRKSIHNYRKADRRLFAPRKANQTWAFHHGGRGELQFNVGIDRFPNGAPAFRAGIAFSFETSRSLTNIEIFLPKVQLFNDWLLEHSESLYDLTMWSWRAGKRSDDRLPAPIDMSHFQAGNFIFLGIRQPLADIDEIQILRTFDRLFPIYERVERQAKLKKLVSASKTTESVFHRHRGRTIEGGRWIQATFPERTLNIFLRHREIQRRLEQELLAEGFANIRLEVPFGARYIDTVADHGNQTWFFEVKTAQTVRACLREAVGQLLEYALWPGAVAPSRLVVVGEPSIDEEAERYIARLNRTFPIPLHYRQLSLET
jgi:hypothetical protein